MASLHNRVNANIKPSQPGAKPTAAVRKPANGLPLASRIPLKPAVVQDKKTLGPTQTLKLHADVKKEQEVGSSKFQTTLSGLRNHDQQQHKKIRTGAERSELVQTLIRTAGKENGLISYRERPADVKDIYAEDVGNESLVVAYVEHIYTYLHQREKIRVKSNYMDGMSVNPRMRAILMDWIVSVAYKFKMCQDTLFLAVDIVDRFLAIPTLDATKDELQLIGVTAMFIASKFEEVYPPELEDFVFIADNACTKQQILEAEMMITNALNFQFTLPTPAHFLRRCCKAASATSEEYCNAKYVTELTLLKVEYVEQAPSLTAAAAMYLTLLLRRGTDASLLWDGNMEYYSFYTEKDVKPAAAKLFQLLSDAAKSRQQCIYKKYSSPKMYEVALTSTSLISATSKFFPS